MMRNLFWMIPLLDSSDMRAPKKCEQTKYISYREHQGGGRPAPKFLIKYAFGEILKNTVLREMFLASIFF